MDKFIKALTSNEKNDIIAKEFNYFGKLIGSWEFDYIDNNISSRARGEWHFSWILEGAAVQDVIILASCDTGNQNTHLNEYGTTIRVYNPGTSAWDIAYCYTGEIIRLEAKKKNNMIILTNIEDESKKWVFVKIEDDNFHWQNITVKNDGTWHINADLYAKRNKV